MQTIFKCNKCDKYFTEDEVEVNTICLEEELGVLGDFNGRTMKEVDCCPYCNSMDFDDFRSIDNAEDIVEVLNKFNRQDYYDARKYRELINKDIFIVGGKGVFRSFKEENKQTKFIQRKTAREILDVMYDVFVYNHKDVMVYMTELERKIKERYDIKDEK